jgi:hypothetical protein
LQSSAQVLLVPVLLKERVAALLIALSSEGDDLAALELLVQVTQLTLDIQAFRKASPSQAAETAAQRAVPVQPVATPPAAVQAQPVYTSIAKIASMAHIAQSPAPEPAYAAAATPSAVVVAASPTALQQEVSLPAVAPVLDEAHEKARRFAKLLVEEIKLYNQTKVAEGRARSDLYSRLREDIEKSRAAYQKRYGESVRDVDYFTRELMRILADNDSSVMGPGFPG